MRNKGKQWAIVNASKGANKGIQLLTEVFGHFHQRSGAQDGIGLLSDLERYMDIETTIVKSQYHTSSVEHRQRKASKCLVIFARLMSFRYQRIADE